jgi:hypothetical protein
MYMCVWSVINTKRLCELRAMCGIDSITLSRQVARGNVYVMLSALSGGIRFCMDK